MYELPLFVANNLLPNFSSNQLRSNSSFLYDQKLAFWGGRGVNARWKKKSYFRMKILKSYSCGDVQ